jgi:outer membrane protein OmpA-like peptidoglycan-associated protein
MTMSSKMRILAALGGLLLGGLAWLAAPPDAAANGWHGHYNNCCYGHGYWGGWGYPRIGIGFGFGFPYGGYYRPGFYGAAYPAYGYGPPPYPAYGGYPPPPVYISKNQPPPAPAAAAQPYIVYFDFDRATLTPQGRQVIDQAIAAANNGGHPLIQVTGYTDAAGADQYNMALSNRRADAVADYMVAHGVPAAEIEVTGVGEQPQQVPTPDGVPNAQNRRVVINVGGGPANVAAGYGNAQQGGGDCQPFQTTITIDQHQQQAYGRACRQADGSWKVVP